MNSDASLLSSDLSTQTNDANHLVVFRVNQREFALPIHQVAEIIRMAALTPLPETPNWFAGMLNLRGQITPIIDLGARLGLDSHLRQTSARIIVLQTHADLPPLGLAVDAVDNVLPVAASDLTTNSSSLELTPAIAAIAHINGRLIPLLDTQSLILAVAQQAIPLPDTLAPADIATGQETGSSDTIADSILEERAERLAHSLGTLALVQGTGYVIVQLGKEKYGISLAAVQEIRPATNITRVPSTPPFYAGLVNLRGHLFAALDLRRYLGLGEYTLTARTRLVLIAAANLELCLIVDEVFDIRWIPDAVIQPWHSETLTAPHQLFVGITPDFISILHLQTLLSDPVLVVQDQPV